MGAPNTGVWNKYSFIFLKAARHNSSHSNYEPFFIWWLKGWQRPMWFEMNLRIYAKWPWSPRSSLRFLGSRISWIALIFNWSILIPLWWTVKPKNFPEVTSNKHLSGFVFNWYLHNRSKIRQRSCMWQALFLDMTTKSSTLNCFMEHIVKNCLHCHLVSSSYIVKSKGHPLIAKNAFRCAGSCGLLIFWRYQNLIVSYGTLRECQCFMPCSWVDHDFCDRQWEIIFWTSVVEIPKVYTNTNCPFFFLASMMFTIHIVYLTSWMKPASMSLLTSFAISSTNSGRKHAEDAS